jgi:hypothetical protein
MPNDRFAMNTPDAKRSKPDADRQYLTGAAVVVYATEDDQYAEVRQAAEGHARAHRCTLILYAADVASAFSEPMPNQWASEGEGERFSDRLSPDDLEFLGRSAIAEQVRQCRRAGVNAAAWLPKDKGVEALAAYASAEGVHAVYVPASLGSIGDLRRLLVEAHGVSDPARPLIDLAEIVTGEDSSATGHVDP